MEPADQSATPMTHADSGTDQTVNPFLLNAVPYTLSAGQRIYSVFKRLFDFLISLIALLLLIVPFLIIALFIRSESKGPVIFRQERVGKGGKLFTIFKFRTMFQEAPSAVATGDFEDSAKYITRVGRFLRRTSLDELPQLFNVFLGDMSLIGPRPLILEERRIHLFRQAHHIYLVRPGITGNAQVNGRDDITFEDKMERDLEYLHHFSFWMDLKILLKTFVVVFNRDGVAF